MASQSITPVASTSTASDKAITNVESDSIEKRTIHSKKKKDEINYNLATGWLRMVEPRKVPYFPQKKDKIVYLRQAHECYLKEVVDLKIFDVTESDKLWLQMEIDIFQYLIVTNVSFKKFPPRVACLEVRRINEEEQASGPVFNLNYHDMGDVVEFLVLKHIFMEGLQMKWNVGDRFRCLVGNKWFFGTIKSKEPFENKYPESPFKSLQIKWDDDEEDQMSPWEIQRINENRLPENYGEPVEVDPTEIEKMRYEPSPDDWPNEWNNWEAIIKNLISEIDLLMSLPISKCFVEIKNDPIYDALVSYPVDLSTIKQRIHNHFYRRIDSLLLDISYLKDNAKEHKPEQVYEEPELITQVCHDILNKCEKDSNDEKDTSIEKLKKFLYRFNSSESSDDDNEYNPNDTKNDSSNRKGRPSNSKNNWKIGCKQLLTTLWNSEDMLPFRQPVRREDFHYEVISSPICLEEIKAKFNSNLYESPKEMFEDIKLIITNSRTYNKDKERDIYHATTRVSALFEELKKQLNSKKVYSRKKNKSIPSRREKQKNSNRKPKEENVPQQMDPINQKSSNQDENIADETETHSKNNNDTKDLPKVLSVNDNDTNLTRIVSYVQTLNFTESKQNKGNENKCSKKENMQKQDSMKRKQLQFMNEHNFNESPKKKLHTSTVEEDRMEVVEGNSKTNNSNNSEFDNNDCKIIENNCTDQFNNEPKSPQILQSQTEDSLDSFTLQVSDDEHGHQEAPASYKNEAVLTQSPNHSTENGDKYVNKSLQNNYNEDLSKASSANGGDTNLAIQTSNLAIIQSKEEEMNVVKNKIFKEEDSTKREVVQSVNEKTSNESSKKNVDNDDCEIIENDCADQFDNEPKSSQISPLQRTGSIDLIIVIDSDIDDDEEYGKVIKSFGKADDPTHSQTHSTANTNKDVNKCFKEQSHFKSSLASTKANSMKVNVNEEKHQEVTKSCIKTGDFTQSQAHCTESTNQINLEPDPSYILQSQIEVSTVESIDLQDIKEEQEHQDPPQSCSNVDLAQLQTHSVENSDKDNNNDSSQKKSNVKKPLASIEINSINMNDDEKKHQIVTKSCIKTRDFTELQAHYTESTNQINVEPEPSYILQSQVGVSTESVDVQDIKEEQEHQDPPKSCNKIDLTQSHNHSTESRNKDVNDSSQKNSNVKKSLASFKARKRMQLKYKRIFQHRPHKSCDLCQCIKRTYLAHLKSHHTFNTS